jgi:hypothetical protein
MGFDGDLSCRPEILRLRGELWLAIMPSLTNRFRPHTLAFYA